MTDIHDQLKQKRAEVQADLDAWANSLTLKANEQLIVRFTLEAEVLPRVQVRNVTSRAKRNRKEMRLCDLLTRKAFKAAGVGGPNAIRVCNQLTDEFKNPYRRTDINWETMLVDEFVRSTSVTELLRVPHFGRKSLQSLNEALAHYGFPIIV